MAIYSEEGEISMLERITELIHYKNNEVSPIELEDVLLSHKDVLEAAVVPVPDEIDGELPMAFIKKVQGSKVKTKF